MLFSVFTRKGKVPRHYFYSPRSQFSSVQFSCSVVSDSLLPHGLLHTRPPCPSPALRACSNSCPLSWWCHPTISSSVVPFSSCLQSFPASGSFLMSQFFSSGGQSIGVSASTSVLPLNVQDYFQSWLRSQNSVGSSFRARFPHLAQLSSLRKPGTQPKWPSVSSGHRNRGDQVSLTAAQTNDKDGGEVHHFLKAWAKASGGP